MCYSAKDSIVAFMIGFVSSSLVLIKAQRSQNSDLKFLGGIFFFVSFMQLFDYVFWKHPQYNSQATKLAILANHMQPVVLFWLARRYGNLRADGIAAKLFYLYTLAAVPYTLNAWKRVQTTEILECSGCPNKQIVKWKWNYQAGAKVVYGLYLAAIVAMMYECIQSPVLKWMSILFITLSFLFSTIKYDIIANHGRMWCYFAAFFPVLLLFVQS